MDSVYQINQAAHQGSAGPCFVNQDRDWKISPFFPAVRLGPGFFCLESRCCDRDLEWILINAPNETGISP